MTLVSAPIALPYWFFKSLISYSVMALSVSIGIYLLSIARSSLMNMLRLAVPMGRLLKHENIGYP